MSQDEPSERSLSYEDDRIILSRALEDECEWWLLYDLGGQRRTDAIQYLRKMLGSCYSDGVNCNMLPSSRKPDAHGTCMCARMMLLLHDMPEEAASRELFARLYELNGWELPTPLAQGGAE